METSDILLPRSLLAWGVVEDEVECTKEVMVRRDLPQHGIHFLNLAQLLPSPLESQTKTHRIMMTSQDTLPNACNQASPRGYRPAARTGYCAYLRDHKLLVLFGCRFHFIPA